MKGSIVHTDHQIIQKIFPFLVEFAENSCCGPHLNPQYLLGCVQVSLVNKIKMSKNVLFAKFLGQSRFTSLSE